MTHPMTPHEARDMARLLDQTNAIQASMNALATQAGKRLGLPEGTAMRVDMDACEWVVPEAPEAPEAPEDEDEAPE